ncbi:hypothetical protein ACFE04_023239 [Oxalis oulophora]
MIKINNNKALLLLLTTLVLLLLQFKSSIAGSNKQQQAYATLLYGDEFVLGVRVLGKSIKATTSAGSHSKDMVVLVSDGVSDYAKSLLKADGWIVEKISLLANPNEVRPKRFWGVYTKLKIFNMTNYNKVVYLDADTIVVKNIEDLFKCRKFCANLKHSERLNSGVMVVEPSKTLFNDMMTKVKTLPSYTGGDQGFLNSYYSDFPNARVFDPTLTKEELSIRPVPEMERLSTLYNADVGLYMLANKWMVDESELRVIHYTLGPLKPWDWWTAWLLKPVDVWQNVREQLEDSLPGTAGGRNPTDDLLVKILYLLPVCALVFCCYRSLLKTREYLGLLCRSSLCDHIRHLYYQARSATAYGSVSTTSSVNSNHMSMVPGYLGAVSICVCFMSALVSLGFSVAIVPRQVMPWTGLLLMYEWTFTMFFILFGGFLHFCDKLGKMAAIQAGLYSSAPETFDDDDSGKGHGQVPSHDLCTCYYGLGMAFLAIAVPSVPFVFGITALFLRLGIMVAGGIVLASFMTYAAEHLAIRSFLRGLEDRGMTRTRSSHFFC